MKPSNIILRPMERADWQEVAGLIYEGTNHWYQSHGMNAIFTGAVEDTQLFCEVYEDLDPGCCILAIEKSSQQIVGSCFFHPRETHISLGIMNVHPDAMGQKIASRLLAHVTEMADNQRKPVRLVSSALNLDSFSLYTRAGFTPRTAYQDMTLSVPMAGIDHAPSGLNQVRKATLADVSNMVALEMELNQIAREKDFRYFIENKSGIWHVSVYENDTGDLDGFLVSVQHAASNMLGPGVARTDRQAAALIHAELNCNRGRSPVFLIPVARSELVKTMYEWGARNCEIHFAQVRGNWATSSGVVMPTFMPETG
ncbi:MAG: GNAT family N-acetyltransferase [Planctomycetaceae bacterium]|nr:GNAT family N-acetyltransferase [Planctomycetaceae bacterium]